MVDKKPKVLVVDDDQLIVRLIEKTLQQTGYDILTAFDGEQGLHEAREHCPDLVILDVMMPKLNGLEVCRQLKEDPDTSLIPVIMLTSKDFVDDKVTGFELGANDYITKPFNPKEFIARVKSHVDGTIYRHKHEEEEKLKALEIMLDQVAHEVRNPIVAIGGFARRIRDRLPKGDPLGAYAGNIILEVSRLERMMNEIIAFKTIVITKIAPFDPVDMIIAVLARFDGQLKEYGILVETQLPAERSNVRADEENFALAVSNIITNAIESMDEGGGRLVVGFEQDAERCRITVQDTGRGIKQSEINQVFRPFYTSKMSGAGMGLAVVRHIADMHQGSVRITSERGKGTSVELTVPNEYSP